ncbi:Hsp20/alpha crystallin family protein [Fibrobacterota bacterium]
MTTELEKKPKQEVKTTAAEHLRDAGTAYAPDVDIYLNEEEILIGVDLPGVEKGDVNIEINENNALIIRAKNSQAAPEKPVLRQFNIGNYYRAFQISEEFDKDKVSGKLENGLLKVSIPKREEAKPKRIKINA